MMSFADYFKFLGHEVKVYANFDPPHPPGEKGHGEKTFLEWYNYEHLTYNDFCLGGVVRRYGKRWKHPVPEEWQDLDMLLVPYGGYSPLQAELPNTRVVCWIIHPAQAFNGMVEEIWTNSNTTKGWLIKEGVYSKWESHIHSIQPPHDYGIFRRAAKPFEERRYNLVCVGGLIGSKRTDLFDALARKIGKGVIIGSLWNWKKGEGEALIPTLRTAARTNVPAKEVAQILGDARVFVTFTETESCALTIYEALNAGCRCVVTPVGAAAEQMGAFGKMFWAEAEAERLVREFLVSPGPDPRQQGILFDRVSTHWKIDARLEAIERSLRRNRGK